MISTDFKNVMYVSVSIYIYMYIYIYFHKMFYLVFMTSLIKLFAIILFFFSLLLFLPFKFMVVLTFYCSLLKLPLILGGWWLNFIFRYDKGLFLKFSSEWFLYLKVEPRYLYEVCLHLDKDSICKAMGGLLYLRKYSTLSVLVCIPISLSQMHSYCYLIK